MSAPIVFFDIAGPDSSVLSSFYSAIFGWEIGDGGTFSTSVVAPTIDGAIRNDPAEKVFYIGVADITGTLSEVVALGGTIDQPRFEVPGVVVLGLFNDPAGNRVGLVEMVDGNAKIP